MLNSDLDMPNHGPNASPWGGTENQVFARFYREHMQDYAASQDSGTPQFKAVDMVEIRVVGDKDSVKEFVNEAHKRRFARAWMAYQQGIEQMQDGTPLHVLFPHHPEVVKTLQSANIWTVQGLAGAPDSMTGIQFLFDFRKKAQTYLEGVEKGKGFHELEKRAEQAELRNIELEDLVKSLTERVTALEKPKLKE